MTERILIDSIKVDRELDAGVDLDDLILSIQSSGLKVPLLLINDNVLVDGLKRLTALKAIGRKHADVIVAATFEDAVNNIHNARAAGEPWPSRRIWEVTQQVQPLLDERTAKIRRAGNFGIPMAERTSRAKERSKNRPPRARELLDWALMTRDVSRIQMFYRQVERGGRTAETVLPLLEAGEITVNQALHRSWDLTPKLRGNVRSLSEQRQLITGAVRSLSGLVKGLEKLGSPVRLPEEELSTALTQLKADRAILSRVIRLLQEEQQDG